MEKKIEKINKIKECKFCLDSNYQEDLISPCYCKGSLEYVHQKCLEKYHLEYDHKSDKCGICEYFYNFDIEIKYNIFFKLFIKFFLLYFYNFISIITCFNQDIYYFIKITFFLLVFNKTFEYINSKYLSNNYASDFIYKKLLNVYNSYYLLSNLILLFYKIVVNIGLIIHHQSIIIFKYVYIIISLLHFIKILYFIYKKSVYKKILNIKIISKKVL